MIHISDPSKSEIVQLSPLCPPKPTQPTAVEFILPNGCVVNIISVQVATVSSFAYSSGSNTAKEIPL